MRRAPLCTHVLACLAHVCDTIRSCVLGVTRGAPACSDVIFLLVMKSRTPRARDAESPPQPTLWLITRNHNSSAVQISQLANNIYSIDTKQFLNSESTNNMLLCILCSSQVKCRIHIGSASWVHLLRNSSAYQSVSLIKYNP